MEQFPFQERRCSADNTLVVFDGSFVWLRRQEPGQAAYAFGQLNLSGVNSGRATAIRGITPNVSDRKKLLVLEPISREEAVQLRVNYLSSSLVDLHEQIETARESARCHHNDLGSGIGEDVMLKGLYDQAANQKSRLDHPLNENQQELQYGFAVYTDDKRYLFLWGTMQQILYKLFKLQVVYKDVKLNSRELSFHVGICGENPYGLELSNCAIQVGKLNYGNYSIPVEEKLPTKRRLRKDSHYRRRISMPMSAIVAEGDEEDSRIPMEGNACALILTLNGYEVRFPMRNPVVPNRKYRWQRRRNPREIWLPLTSVYVGDYAFHVRRSAANTFIFFKRKVEPIEMTAWYRFIESPLMSFLLFYLGKLLSRIPGHKKNALFFEKFTEKAEEGTFELCQMCSDSKRTRCWYIIDGNSPDYQRIKDDPCTVRKFSFKYYWLIYNANYFIAAEAPIHLTIFNSHNRYLRWSLLRHPFIFLQHGITYMKRQGKTSTFLRGRAGEAQYIVVSSDKERDVVTRDFEIPRNRIWVTGMLMFDRCAYKHMNQSSPDKVTVMLTWKPYEAVMEHFEDSSYYKNTMAVYHQLLRCFDRSQINIVAHPHAYEPLKHTPMADLIWDKPISEVLKDSKLLITDYSSVCWNSFYQGGAVIFFQPDLEEYEASVGKLIPSENEYIGHRVFELGELEELFRKGIHDGVIDLSFFRSEKHEKIYNTINQFHDGKNTQRVKEMLKQKKFI